MPYIPDAKHYNVQISKRATVPRPARLPARQKIKFSKTKKKASKAALRKKIREWAKNQKAPDPKTKRIKPRGRLITKKDMKAFTAVRSAAAPHLEALKVQKMDMPALVGLQWSMIATQEYALAKTAYQTAVRKIGKLRKSPAEKRAAIKKVNAEWKKVFGEYRQSFASVGVENVSESRLDMAARAMVADKDAYNEFQKMAAGVQPNIRSLTTRPRTISGFVSAATQLIPSAVPSEIEALPTWCGLDPVTGTRTEHWSVGFAVNTTIDYPCGVKWCTKWGVPYPCGVKWCRKTITLIGGDISFALDIGYEIDCCGATAWGAGEVKACATILGVQECAGCTAAVQGVTGVEPMYNFGNACGYGLGIAVTARCYLGGYEVFNGTHTFGYMVFGPCPPAGVCG